MRFLVDAQLPPLLADWLRDRGYDTIHTNDLPDREETQDNYIRQVANEQQRIVVTKDVDFYDSCLLHKQPAKLLFITTGNLKNRQLLDLFRNNFATIADLFATCNLVELTNEELIVHD